MTEERIENKKKFPLKNLIILGIVAVTLISAFVLNWLYGPKPNFANIFSKTKSYLGSNQEKNIEKTNTLHPAEGELSYLNLPEGFKINLFAQDLGGPNVYVPGPNYGSRHMVIKGNTVFTTLLKNGQVLALTDSNNDGVADEKKVFLDNLNLPHGIDKYQDWIYIGETDKIIRVKDTNNDGVAEKDTLEKLIDLPGLGIHFTRTVHIIDDKLYFTMGSSCNSCFEEDQRRASLTKCDLDGKNCQIIAPGLRNSVDFTKFNDKIYALDTGKDLIGNDNPPDEINIVEEGKNYGWPYCFGKQVHDVTFDEKNNPCPETQAAWVDLPAHVAPLGIIGYTGASFPAEYKDKLIVALHGSYLSKPPVGYKVVTVDTKTGQISDFITGFINGDDDLKGRPVGVVNYRDGLLISDDMSGKIYKVSTK